MKKVGFIDYYLDEWHTNNYPRWIRQFSNGEMEVAYAYGLIDSPLAGRRTNAQWSKDLEIPLVDSIEELIEKSDYLVVLSPDNCEMHEQLCQLPLRSGKRTYVDKTFAPDGVIARRIFAIAEESGTPCYSTSALRFAEEYQPLRGRQYDAIAAWGPGNFETYSIHQLEPVMMLMQARAESVLYLPAKDAYTLLIRFEGGRTASLTGLMNGSPFALNAAGPDGNQMAVQQVDSFSRFIPALIRFFETGEAPVSHEETIAIMDVRGAGLKAIERPGEWIDVK